MNKKERVVEQIKDFLEKEKWVDAFFFVALLVYTDFVLPLIGW